MNTNYHDLLGFLGYGEARRSIWFVGHEEHGAILGQDDKDWEKWIHEKREGQIRDTLTVEGNAVALRWNAWKEGDEKDWIGYQRCAKVVEKLHGLTRSEGTWKHALMVNLLILPHINEGKGQDWTPWLHSHIGAEHWTLRDYNREVKKDRTIVLAEAAVRLLPEAIILMGSEARTLHGDPTFQQIMGKAKPVIHVFETRHPSIQGLNSRPTLTEDEWINALIKEIKK